MKLRILNLAAAMVAVLCISSSCQKDPVQDSIAGKEQKQTAAESLTQGMETIKFSDGSTTTGKWVNGTFLDATQLQDLADLESKPSGKMQVRAHWSNRISLCKKPFKGSQKIIYVDVSLLKHHGVKKELKHHGVKIGTHRHFHHYLRNAAVAAAYYINGIGKLGIKFIPVSRTPRHWGDRLHTIKIRTHNYKDGVPVFFSFPHKGRVGKTISFNKWYTPINSNQAYSEKRAFYFKNGGWNLEYFRGFRYTKRMEQLQKRSRNRVIKNAALSYNSLFRVNFANKLRDYMVQGLLGNIGFTHADYKNYKSCYRYKNNVKKHRSDWNNGYRFFRLQSFPKGTHWKVKRRYNGHYTRSIMTACDPRPLAEREERLIVRGNYPAWRAKKCKNVRGY